MEQEQVDNVEEPEEIINETTEAVVEDGEVSEETTEDEEQETEEEESELEDWMKEDSEEENDEKPVKFLKAKKRLKGVIAEKDDELERLKAENEALKNKQVSKPVELKRPDPLDFDTDEAYNAALDDYHISLYESRQQQTHTVEKQKEIKRNIQAAADAHYERVETLMKESGISPEKYRSADTKLRQIVEAEFPKRGDIITDNFLGVMGDGSEKVAYYIGNNETARLKFQALLREDPLGIKAAMFLGEQKNRLNNTTQPKKQKSKASPPASNASGDVKNSSREKALKKKYTEAHKKGDGQTAFNAKKEARKAGIDVSKW
jgi:hypothetical protein